MGPKQKRAAKAAAGPKVGSRAPRTPPPPTEPRTKGPASDVNAAYNAELLAAAATIKAHRIFQDLATSTGPNFDVEQYKSDLETKGFHRFEGNAFLAVIKGYDDAPVSRKRVNDWQNKHYDIARGHLPATMDYTFKIATLPQDGGLQDPNNFGKLALLSPPEPLDALVFRVAQAIDDEDDDSLGLWRSAILTAPMMIMNVESPGKADWKRIDERESFGRAFEMLYRTALGRAFEVLDIVAKEEERQQRELDASEVEALWKSNVTASGMGDQVTKTYIDTLLKCKKRVFSDADATAKLLQADETYGVKGPFDSLYKIEVLATKVGTRETPAVATEKLNWMIEYVLDRVLSRTMTASEFSVNGLSGKGCPGNKGLLDLALYKAEVSKHSLYTVLETLPGDARSKELIREHGKGFKEIRSCFGYPNDTDAKKNPWVSLMDLGLQRFIDLHRKMVFNQDYDGSLKQSLRACRSAKEAMEEGAIKAKVDEINELVKKADSPNIIGDGSAAGSEDLQSWCEA